MKLILRFKIIKEKSTLSIIKNMKGDIMGDKSPKSIGKNKKQKDSEKVKTAQKAQAQIDAKKSNAINPKKK